MAPGGIQKPGMAVKQVGLEDQRQEYSWNGLPPMPGGRNAVEGGIRETDDGSGSFLPGEEAGLGTVQGVQGGDGTRVAGGPYADTEWEGSGWETSLGNHALQREATYLNDGLPNLRGNTELPR